MNHKTNTLVNALPRKVLLGSVILILLISSVFSSLMFLYILPFCFDAPINGVFGVFKLTFSLCAYFSVPASSTITLIKVIRTKSFKQLLILAIPVVLILLVSQL